MPASDGDHPSLGVGGVGVDGVSPRVGSARGDQRHTTCLLGGSSHGPILTLTLSNSTTLTLTSTLTLTNSGSQADLEERVSSAETIRSVTYWASTSLAASLESLRVRAKTGLEKVVVVGVRVRWWMRS